MKRTACISVILPVHNGAGFIAEAVASIRAQRRPPGEILIVDDGSTDNTWELASSLEGPIHCVRRSSSGGPAAARNHGLSLAEGDVIAFLDVDDLWPEDKLEVQLPVLCEEPGVDVVMGRTRTIVEPDARPHEVSGREVARSVQVGSGLFRRSVFERVGRFDERLRYSEDQDWFLRARDQGVEIRFIDRVTLLYRIHSGNMTRQAGAGDYQLPQVLKRALDRRRRRE